MREEIVPIRPTSQGENIPAHSNPGGSQWMALERSARLLMIVNTSVLAFVLSFLRVECETALFGQREGGEDF